MADGVRLDFVVRENLFFNQVRIEGLKAPPSDASAAAAMQLALGQTYRRAAVDEAVERLQETLRDEGLYQAKVSAETAPHPETHQMDIIVHVKPGPRARVGIIQLKNETRSEEHTSELQLQFHLVCRLLLEKKKKQIQRLEHELKKRINITRKQ